MSRAVFARTLLEVVWGGAERRNGAERVLCCAILYARDGLESAGRIAIGDEWRIMLLRLIFLVPARPMRLLVCFFVWLCERRCLAAICAVLRFGAVLLREKEEVCSAVWQWACLRVCESRGLPLSQCYELATV